MKKLFTQFLFLSIIYMLSSCISLKDIQLIQPDQNLKLDSKGMIEYNIPEYRLQKHDYILINVSTTNPEGMGILSDFITSGNRTAGGTARGGTNSGVWIREDGAVELPRIGKIYVEGLTIKEAREKIQTEFYKIFTPQGTFIDVNLSGIEYIVIGESGNGVKNSSKKDLSLLEALASIGNNQIYADLKKVRIIRTTPEGTKQVYVDLTKESIMNSEYYWIQNNDIIVINPRKEKVWGIGLNPLSVVTTTMGVIGTILGVYLFIDRF